MIECRKIKGESMKNKKIILIVIILLVFVLVAGYITIDRLYEIARKDNIECCLCWDYYQPGDDGEISSMPAVCCECNYNIFEKLSYIIGNI